MITSSRDEGHFLGQGARAQAVWDPLSQMSGLGKFGSCAVSVSVWEGFTLTPRRHTFRGPSKSEGSSLAPPRLPQTCPDSSPPPAPGSCHKCYLASWPVPLEWTNVSRGKVPLNAHSVGGLFSPKSWPPNSALFC